MSNEEKVKELVECVAKLIRSVDAMRGDAEWGGDDPHKELFERHKNVYRQKAKQILSNPDYPLALIDREKELPELETFPHPKAPANAPFKLGQRRMRTRIKQAGFVAVIPLAPAIKEIEDGHEES